MNIVLAVLVVVTFAVVIERARLAVHVRDVVQRARANYALVADPSLSDDQKERRLRDETPQLLALLARIVFWSLLALVLPLAALWIIDRIGIASMSGVLDLFLRLDFLLAVTAAAVLAVWLLRRRQR